MRSTPQSRLESPLIRTRRNVGGGPTFLLTECCNFRQACPRAKSVGRLRQELRLTLFPHGKPREQGSVAKMEVIAMRISETCRRHLLRREIRKSSPCSLLKIALLIIIGYAFLLPRSSQAD